MKIGEYREALMGAKHDGDIIKWLKANGYADAMRDKELRNANLVYVCRSPKQKIFAVRKSPVLEYAVNIYRGGRGVEDCEIVFIDVQKLEKETGLCLKDHDLWYFKRLTEAELAEDDGEWLNREQQHEKRKERFRELNRRIAAANGEPFEEFV